MLPSGVLLLIRLLCHALSSRIRHISPERRLDILQQIPLAHTVTNPNIPRPQTQLPHLPCEPKLVDFAAPAEIFPGAIVGGIEDGDDLAAEKAVDFPVDHPVADVGEEVTDEGDVVVVAAEFDGGFASERGPIATGKVSDGEEGFPDVGGAIVQGGGNLGAGLGDGVAMFGDELSAALPECDGVEAVHAFAFFAGHLALHGDDDAAVGESVGQAADGSHDFGAPAGVSSESARSGWV